MTVREANVVEQQRRLEDMRSEFRAARQRWITKRGIALWNQTEAAHRADRSPTAAVDDDKSD